MESRKDILSTLKRCRFCLSQGELSSLYKKKKVSKTAISLPLKILSCISVEVFPSDKMPAYICNRCTFFMELFYEFKNICRQADKNILHFVNNGNQLESTTWPSSLTKVFLSQAKPEGPVMKTVVESGATVQLTTDDLTDTDIEDDENVYNIKISDGSDDESKSTCIKIIPGSDKEDTPKRKTKGVRKDTDETVIFMDKTQTGDIDEGCWPCDECDCTYPLQQLLELHKMQKHRFRDVKCDQCDDKFFTKYDLAIHRFRHINDKLFQCVACDKTFKRNILLKRHEKAMHADMPQRVCLKCPATFLSIEELKVHQHKHAKLQNKPFVCPLCDKKFPEKSSLQRHKDTVHDQKALFQCEYCPERHTTVSKLARHVRSHVGERAYPCKYCDKTFTKSHHYTRHLRVKHREMERSQRELLTDQDQLFRCDQCEDSFATQDELIYHSAIHATQNLICPLCQEKFADVDEVTAHIKSHVTDAEYMCDYCELIFTTKSKLDNHIAIAHDDEEMDQGESSMEFDADDDLEDDAINVKEENGEMVVEIKKADDFMITNYQGDSECKVDNSNSDESDTEETYTEVPSAEPVNIVKKTSKSSDVTLTKITNTPMSKQQVDNSAKPQKTNNQAATISRKVEETKNKFVQNKAPEQSPKKKEKINKTENNNTGASEKSLRLLEKELQDLKRTNSRSEIVKNTLNVKTRKAQVHTSTPKLRNSAVKEFQLTTSKSVIEKKVPERRLITKENKESKDTKDPKNNNSIKEEKEKEVVEKELPKEKNTNVKIGSSDKNSNEERVRRSTRPSKIKDYARMVRDSSQGSNESSDESDDDEEDDDEFKNNEKSPEPRQKLRRSSVKQQVTPKPMPTTSTVSTAPRKRGRPRKEPQQLPSKVRKEDNEEKDEIKSTKPEQDNANAKESSVNEQDSESKKNTKESSTLEAGPSSSGVLISPTGQTLKKVPIKALPPGVKPLPLPPTNARLGNLEVCEMQIGNKMVKVQKIVMTKAEVEAMAKKGLVEMKDGTVVLKQGIKSVAVKSALVGEGEIEKESPSKKDKPTPTRCDLGDEV